jgi:hypothetical protein
MNFEKYPILKTNPLRAEMLKEEQLKKKRNRGGMRGSEKARNQTLAIESWMESKKVSYFFT